MLAVVLVDVACRLEARRHLGKGCSQARAVSKKLHKYVRSGFDYLSKPYCVLFYDSVRISRKKLQL